MPGATPSPGRRHPDPGRAGPRLRGPEATRSRARAGAGRAKRATAPAARGQQRRSVFEPAHPPALDPEEFVAGQAGRPPRRRAGRVTLTPVSALSATQAPALGQRRRQRRPAHTGTREQSAAAGRRCRGPMSRAAPPAPRAPGPATAATAAPMSASLTGRRRCRLPEQAHHRVEARTAAAPLRSAQVEASATSDPSVVTDGRVGVFSSPR